MALIVQKFGGTSVANPDRIQEVAKRIAATKAGGHEVIAVVSAMAGVTNQLLAWTEACGPTPSPAETDAILASGEQVTAGLLALSLQALGHKARSFLAWQIPIETTDEHGQATPINVATESLKAYIAQGGIPVVAGFQGLSADNRLTTLGRGGSDTTAVIIAASIKADGCEIYTDVDGVYTADPRIVSKASRLSEIPYSTMVALAREGAKVLHQPCVEIAWRDQVNLKVMSSFSPLNAPKGTTIKEFLYDAPKVIGMAHMLNCAYFPIATKHRDAFKDVLRAMDIPGEYVHHNTQPGYIINGRFTNLFEKATLKSVNCEAIPHLTKIALIGLGLEASMDIVRTVENTFQKYKIDPIGFEQKEEMIRFMIPEAMTETVLCVLHRTLGLDKGEIS